MYTIYRLTSPSGRSYTGLTKFTAALRWKQHVRKSRKNERHPLYDAIRSYGQEAFIVEHIASAIGVENAKAVEVACIAQTPKQYSLNISPGGEADGETASAVFWAKMRGDPEAFAAYKVKLKKAMENRVLSPEALENCRIGAAQWRKENPREAWSNSYRASRIALRKCLPKAEDIEEPLKERLLKKHKGIFLSRKRGTTAMWAVRTALEKAELSAKISTSVAALYNDPKHTAKVSKQLETARAGIDREHQAKQASKGLKNYWIELRADPERYAEYMEQRTATLMCTLEGKKNVS